MTKFCLAIPYFGGIDHEHLAGVRELQKRGIECVSVHGVPYIDHARAMLATRILDERDVEAIMWIDHDMVFRPEEVEPMVDRLLASDYAVLGAAYSQKRPHSRIVGALSNPDQEVTFYKPGLYDADGVGFGFTAVKRSTFEALAPTMQRVHSGAANLKVWPFFSHIIDGESYYGEDYSFCKRVRDAGMPLGMDVEPRVWHKGAYCYSLEDLAMAVPNVFELRSVFHPPEEHGPHLFEPAGAKT